MEDKEAAANFYRRADMVREIAKGTYDRTDRRFVRKFVSDSEKLVEPVGRKAPDR